MPAKTSYSGSPFFKKLNNEEIDQAIYFFNRHNKEEHKEFIEREEVLKPTLKIDEHTITIPVSNDEQFRVTYKTYKSILEDNIDSLKVVSSKLFMSNMISYIEAIEMNVNVNLNLIVSSSKEFILQVKRKNYCKIDCSSTNIEISYFSDRPNPI